MRIVYVGLKPLKADNVAGTGLVWSRGDIHEVEEEEKALKLLAHPLVWQDADANYELLPEPSAVPHEPRIKIVPSENGSLYWEPIVITVQGEVFDKLQKKELVVVFMTQEDADAYADWKLSEMNKPGDETVPVETGPIPQNIDKRTRAYKMAMERQKVA